MVPWPKRGGSDSGPELPGLINPNINVKVGILPVRFSSQGRLALFLAVELLTYEIAWHITAAGAGQSTCIGMGGDPIVGLDYIKLLEMFREDPATRGVVLIGEIGGNAEENAAKYIIDTKYPKPVVAYIAGRMAPPGKRMGHAGAIIMGQAGTAKSKIEAYSAAGVPVAEKPSDIIRLLKLS
jgi:succinyl-CoA synthetase alpha subunit